MNKKEFLSIFSTVIYQEKNLNILIITKFKTSITFKLFNILVSDLIFFQTIAHFLHIVGTLLKMQGFL